MLGATLRVKPRLADPCRGNSCVSKLVLDSSDWFIDGSLMLPPTARAACSPVSAYPPRERWVRDAAAYYIGNEK